MKRREFIKTWASAMAGLAAGAAGAGALGRPNVLLILVDQMRRPRWFPEHAGLPNFERLKAGGIEFTRHYTSAVPCSPSRACLFTGLHMDQHGVSLNVNNRDFQESLDPCIPTLGHMFRDAGYRTPYFGKWHLTLKEEYKKEGLAAYGFEEWNEPDRHGIPYEGIIFDRSYADGAIDWIEREGRKGPWFLVCSLINPHDICFYPRFDVPPVFIRDVFDKLPENWHDDLSGKPRCQAEYAVTSSAVSGKMGANDEKTWLHYLDYYYYLTLRIDMQLGRILNALEASGQARDTIVIFTSDHGDMGGSHGLRAKGPFVYEENTNVPLVISWPGRLAGGVSTGALSQNVDLFPTLAGLVGVDVRSKYAHLSGRDLAPVLADPGKGSVNDHVLFSFAGNIMMSLMAKRLGRPQVTSPQNIRAIRERDIVFGRYFDPGGGDQEFEMYDLRNDPFEMRNLAGDPGYRAVEKEMLEKLRDAEAGEMSPLPPGSFKTGR